MKRNLLFLSLVSIPCFAVAQEPTQLATIVVKADSQETDVTGKLKKKATLNILGEKDVLDTPFTIRNYSDQAIQDAHAHTIMDVLKIDPSVRTTTNSGHLNENFNIRGFNVNWDDLNLNGAYGMAPSGRVSTDILSSVTVLKGPNALIAGMAPGGSVGGVIIANTKRAEKELTRVTANFEEEGFYKSGFDVARRFGQDQEFGARLSANYGQGEHVVDGLEDETISAVLGLDWTTDKAKINLDAYSTKDDRKGGSPAMVSFATLGKVLDAPDGRSNYLPNLWGKQSANYVGLSSEYKLLENLKVIAGIGTAEQKYQGHLFGTRLVVTDETGNANSQYYHVKMNQRNTTANLGLEGAFYTGDIHHTVGLRADYLHRDTNMHSKAGETKFVTNLYNPSNAGFMPSVLAISQTADNDYISYSLTDQISMLNDKLQFILGARYQEIDINNPTNPKNNYSENKLSPSLGIVVKPWGEDISLYASYVEGLSQGNTVTTETDVNFGKTFAPFQTKQYEVGAKYQHGSWLHTLAAYQIEKPSTITEVYATPINGSTQITTDGGETTSKGLEYGFSGNVTDDVIIWGNLAYIDAEYTKGMSGKVELSGNTVEGQPEFTAGLGIEYKLPVDGLSVNARANYVYSQYLNNTNTLELPDYTLLDIGAKYTTNLGGVDTTFRANIDNVTDEKYWAGVFNSGFTTLGAGRTYKLGVSFDF
ncbi:TonB-dependent receptor [Acinetobacter sp. DSM 11652]|uniref:TonB-dependent receptor n=1 Tax=Acinetobacter sp. DSM 11652 TaxID=346222 RepID=UPI0008B0ECD1|nr:TonB-dependent siderophore receptor [Acinetobacter sp. DSM 11652]SEL89073.1 iron complex outermembrane recepter protein [Acinetobacter sp. DSM 11652]